jgi:tetratricopeptide (TPR) repeat protein
MMKPIFRVLLATTAVALTACTHTPTGAEDFQAGRVAFQKHPAEALADYNNALQKNYRTAQVYYDRAIAYQALNKSKEAEADYTTALSLVGNGDKTLLPQFVNLAHYYRGFIRMGHAQWTPAINDFVFAVRAFPRDSHSWNFLGYSRLQVNDYRDAVADFNHGLAIQPNDPNDHYNRGLALFNTNQFRQAIPDFSNAIQAHQKWGAPYQWRGRAYFSLADYHNAELDFTKAIDIIPKAWAWDYRCETRENLGNIRGALSDCNHAVSDYPTWEQAYIDRGWAKSLLGANGGALQDMNTAVKYGKNDPNAYKWRGWVNERVSRYRAAFADYARARQIQPGYQPAIAASAALGTFILNAQHAGIQNYGIASIDVNREEHESAPQQSEYQKRVGECGGYFDESSAYFQDCVDKSVDEAKSDESSDQQAEVEAQAVNDNVAQRVQEQENADQAEAQATEQRNAEAQNENTQSASESNGSQNSENSEQSSGESQQSTESAPEQEAAPEQESAPAPEPAAPESSSE